MKTMTTSKKNLQLVSNNEHTVKSNANTAT